MPQHAQHHAEQLGDVAAPYRSSKPLDPDAARPEPAQGANEEGHRRPTPFVGQDLDIGQTGGVIDGHVQEVSALALAGPAPVAGDAVADACKTGELLDMISPEVTSSTPISIQR